MRLATIRLDAPATLDIDKCQVPSAKGISDVLQELGYKSLVRRVDIKSKYEDRNSPRLFE